MSDESEALVKATEAITRIVAHENVCIVKHQQVQDTLNQLRLEIRSLFSKWLSALLAFIAVLLTITGWLINYILTKV